MAISGSPNQGDWGTRKLRVLAACLATCGGSFLVCLLFDWETIPAGQLVSLFVLPFAIPPAANPHRFSHRLLLVPLFAGLVLFGPQALGLWGEGMAIGMARFALWVLAATIAAPFVVHSQLRRLSFRRRGASPAA